MVLAHFKNEWRQNPKGFAHGSKMKIPKKRTEIRAGTGKEEYHPEGPICKECDRQLREDINGWRAGC